MFLGIVTFVIVFSAVYCLYLYVPKMLTEKYLKKRLANMKKEECEATHDALWRITIFACIFALFAVIVMRAATDVGSYYMLIPRFIVMFIVLAVLIVKRAVREYIEKTFPKN